MAGSVLKALGGEAGCRQLSEQFYTRVGKDPILRPLFPGKSLRCAQEEFAAFLIQFLGGEEDQTQPRWWLSLRESHARFRIDASQRSAWLRHMRETLERIPLDPETQNALRQFFLNSSAYVIGKDGVEVDHGELAARWSEQRVLDDGIAAIASGRDPEAIHLASRFLSRPAVMVGLFARMVRSGSPRLTQYVIDTVNAEPSLAVRRFAGKSLLHFACGAGCLGVVDSLLRLGTDPNTLDRGGHPPLYSVSNECGSEAGPALVRMLVQAGADVNACGGVTQATALHMAARRGYTATVAALLDCGAAINAKDAKGVTPLQRARNCRRPATAALLLARGAK
jgi:hemoglobin